MLDRSGETGRAVAASRKAAPARKAPSALDLTRLVKSSAHAADCPIGIFARGGVGDWTVAAAFGVDPQAQASGHDMLDQVARIATSDLIIVNDLTTAIAGVAVDTSLFGATPIRFLAAAQVIDGNGARLGQLLLADLQPRAGLSAAQSYMLQTHAAQLAAFLELESYRQRPAPAPALEAKGRWSSTERLRLLESVVVNANDAVLITEAEPIDLPGPRIVYCNAAFERTTGYTEAEVLGKTPRILHSDRTDRTSLDRLKRALTRWRPVEVELLNRRKDGTEFWVELSIAPVANEAGWFTHWVSVQRDVTDRKKAEAVAIRARVAEAENRAFEKEIQERKRVEEKLLYEAFHDDLTTLRNRAFFMDRLETALLEEKNHPGLRSTVLFIDLNRFKLVNDSLGHRAGDVLLMETAQRLRTCLRAEDTLARIGGDEFAILVEDTVDLGPGIAVAQQVIEALSLPIRIGTQDVFSSASLGIARSSERVLLPEELLRNADIAMYEAKNRGSGYAVFAPSMHTEAVKSLEVQTDLRHAVSRDEFRLQFQPIYNPRTSHITGMEALIRWQHPTRGWVGPAAFIPLAEEIGLIREIGRWVLRESCLQMQLWKDRHPALDLRLSVNVSGDELRDPQFMPELKEVLAETGLDPRNLQLEITEGVFLSRPDAIGRVLDEIRALGVRIALDDFGTGYSSLSYLDRYPIDTIKIDQSFVVRMLARQRTLAIVETIIALGQALGLDIVAEGVEDELQLDALLALGCNSVQGFLFARPMPASELDVVLAAASRDA